GALEQARVQVEHVTRIGFTARRATQQQRHLAVGPGLLGQVVVDDQRVFAAVTEVLAHGAAGVRRNVLQRRRLGGVGGHDNRVLHRTVLFELAHHRGDRRALLTHRHVNALDTGALLVDDRVDRHRGLAGLTVADDQLALTAADRHHGVDRLQAGLYRLVAALAGNHTRRDPLDRLGGCRLDGAVAVDRAAQRVDHPTQQRVTHRHLQNAARAAHGVAFLDVGVIAHDHRTDGIALEVERQAVGVAGEFNHLPLHGIGQAVETTDAVGDAHHRAFGARFRRDFELLDALADQFGN